MKKLRGFVAEAIINKSEINYVIYKESQIEEKTNLEDWFRKIKEQKKFIVKNNRERKSFRKVY